VIGDILTSFHNWVRSGVRPRRRGRQTRPFGLCSHLYIRRLCNADFRLAWKGAGTGLTDSLRLVEGKMLYDVHRKSWRLHRRWPGTLADGRIQTNRFWDQHFPAYRWTL